MAKQDWHYTGDMNLECGGMFFKPLDEFGCIEAVQVTPVSAAGGPDNVFYIETGQMFAGTDPDAWQSALDVCGYTLELIPGIDGGEWSIREPMGELYPLSTVTGQVLLADAMRGAVGFDDRQETVVQIGRQVDPLWGDVRGGAWNPEADVILRGNAKLHRYVARAFL